MIKTIVLDIEGTTIPIDFVRETLFPYAKSKLGAFLAAGLASLRDEIAELKSEYRKDFQDQIYGRKFAEDDPETVAKYLEFLIDVDRKSTPLKSIEGRIWRAGFESGDLESPVFADVPGALADWRSEGRTIAVFSSGSVLAQRLIFSHTTAGDLTRFISAYFDTNTGKKQEPESYSSVARELGSKPAECLFVSDTLIELDAARAAGFRTVLSVREGNGCYLHPVTHDAVGALTDIEL